MPSGIEIKRSLAFLLVLGATLQFALAEPAAKKTDAIVATLDAHPSKVVELCDRLRNDPLAPDARQLASLLVHYMAESDRVTVTINAALIDPIIKVRPQTEVQLRMIALFTAGLLSYAIVHGGQAGANVPSNVYALQFLADGYSHMKARNAQTKDDFGERLLTMSQPGAVERYVRDTLKPSSPAPTK